MDQYRPSTASFAGICPNSPLKVVYYGSHGSIWADFWPPGAAIDKFGQLDDGQTSAKALVF